MRCLLSTHIRLISLHQGEQNVATGSSTEDYTCLFAGMINAWRDTWVGVGDFPFLYVQLAPWLTSRNVSNIRIAQSRTAPRIGLDTTGMVRESKEK